MTPRREAALRGDKRYTTGKPCLAGHVAERYTSSGACVECVTFSTPNKGGTPVNGSWPLQYFVFETHPAPSAKEMHAALRYVQDVKWHDAALQALRNDPQLMAQYVTPPTPAEIEAAQALLRYDQRPQEKTGGMTPEAIAEFNARLPK